MLEFLQWEHATGWVVTFWVVKGVKFRFKSHKHIWNVVSAHVVIHGPMSPVTTLRHGLQVFYSNTKCVVDGVSQYRALMRESSSDMNWEQKVVVQSFNNLLVNGFVSWNFLIVF